MKIFISWSGSRSKYIAEILSNWIEQVLQVAEPWISTDIEKGKRWSNEIAEKLSESKVAIIVLTSDNLDSKWVHFEAGAIAQNSDAYVCTLLFDVNPTNVKQPLSQFQHTKFVKSDILKLVKTINNSISKSGGKALKEKNLESVFDTFWPKLEESSSSVPESKTETTQRSDRELIEESLQILRSFKSNRKSSETSETSENELNEVLDFWIEKYAVENEVEHNSAVLEDHIDNIYKYLSPRPEIQILFKTSKYLKMKIEEQVNKLLPF